jgi:hypothetical protein
MATINFPSSPVLNDQYSFEGKTWTFNGDGWVLIGTPITIRIDSAYVHANAAFNVANSLTGGTSTDGWARDAANSAGSYANSAYAQANTATQDANSAGVYANSAYAAANAAYALAQSGGTPLSGEFDYGLITDVNNTTQDYGTL